MIDVLIWAAFFQGLFLSVLYFTSKQHSSFSNKILALFILALLVEALGMFLSMDDVFGYDLNGYFALPEVKLFLPVLVLHYVLLKIKRAEHFILIIKALYVLAFAFLSLTLFNIFLSLVVQTDLVNVFGKQLMNIFYMFQMTFACLASFGVLIISVFELRKYQNTATEKLSDILLERITWLWHFILAMTAVTILWAMEILRIYLGGKGTGNIAYFTWFLLFLFIYYTSYMAFVQKDLFSLEEEEEMPFSEPELIHDQNSVQQEIEDFKTYASLLQKVMSSEKLYLESDLNIYELSKKSNIPSRKITNTIKHIHQTNFSEWVNRFRVDYAISLLQEMSANNLTIEGIGYESGFNSRSAMYLAFKKIKGKSPGDFKR